MKTVVLTGASGRFGQLFLKEFLSDGMEVIALTRQESSKEKLDKLFRSYVESGHLYSFACDFSNDNYLEKLQNFIDSNKLNPTALINNARSISSLKLNDNGLISTSDFQLEFTLGVIVPYQITMALALDQKLNSVVNISSMYGVVAQNSTLYDNPKEQMTLQYGTVKAAQIHMTKELAVKLAPEGIRVNCVSYGGLEGRVDQNFKDRYAKLCPAGKMLSEKDIPGPVSFLISDSASAITGHNLVADGGWSIW